MKTVMQKQFQQVPTADIPRSQFNRSHGVKTTFNSGFLVPFYFDECLPGDTHNLKTAGFARLSTPIYPVMDNMFLETFFFFVPNRLIWTNWVKCMGEQEDPSDSIDFTVPTTTAHASTGYTEQSLQDYLGIPTKINSLEHNNLLPRAYNLIYNQWFRDQNLTDSVVVDKGDGPDTETDYVLLRRAKKHDYFTSALPFLQKGTAVQLPLGTSAPVVAVGANDKWLIGDVNSQEQKLYAVNPTNDAIFNATPSATQNYILNAEADLSSATASTINQFREAIQIQAMLERDARSGTRYTEIIKAHFKVTSPDARLQRTEYLGGGSTPINITPISQTSNDGTNGSLGLLGGMGTTSFEGHGFTKSFTEHGVIIGLVNVRADITYQQGLPRMHSRDDRLDFYFPLLAGLGEQAILNKEIFADGSAADELVFGYQERYAEYRYKPSTIHGRFRSNSTVPLDAWHLSEDFSVLPVLNNSFIESDPPIARVVEVSSEPQFIGDFYHQLTSARPMPVHGVPYSLERF